MRKIGFRAGVVIRLHLIGRTATGTQYDVMNVAGNRLGESPGWVCGWFDAPAQAFNSPALWGSCPEIGRATLAVWDTFLPVIKHRPVFGFLSASSFPAVSATRQKVLKALKSCMAKKELSG